MFRCALAFKDSSACTAVGLAATEIHQIQQLQHNNYQYFVIIHGTDTLSYAAQHLLVSWETHAITIITGSQYPIIEYWGNDVIYRCLEICI